MIRAILYVFEKYGTASLQLITLILGSWAFWKLFTNHLHTMDEKIDVIIEKQKEDSKDIVSIKERVSTLEGQSKLIK